MRFLSLASRNIKEVYRDPVSISLGLAMPAALLVLFTRAAAYKNSILGRYFESQE